MSYKITIVDQSNGNANKWILNKPELMIHLEGLLDTLNNKEIILIEKR